MSNSAVVRALHRRIKFYLNSPIFYKYGRSLRGFIALTSMAKYALFLMLFVVVLFIDYSGDMSAIGNCGTAKYIDK